MHQKTDRLSGFGGRVHSFFLVPAASSLIGPVYALADGRGSYEGPVQAAGPSRPARRGCRSRTGPLPSCWKPPAPKRPDSPVGAPAGIGPPAGKAPVHRTDCRTCTKQVCVLVDLKKATTPALREGSKLRRCLRGCRRPAADPTGRHRTHEQPD